jgi:predicted GNAT superfamily acetyltransferase
MQNAERSTSAQAPRLAATFLDPDSPTWDGDVEALWAELDTSANPELFPAYFVKTAFPKLGGRLARLTDAHGFGCGAALLFPRALHAEMRYVTLRLHAPAVTPDQALAAITPQIAPDQPLVYRPADGRTFTASAAPYGAYSVGAPGRGELAAIGELQRLVWGPEMGHGYPVDLHSAEFAPGSSLVARADGRVVGFLFGFTRFTTPEGLPAQAGQIFLESQLLAINPAHRRSGLAATLKRAQGAAALAAGMHAIHWTADPLQIGNATLNFASLRAIAGVLYPAYYPFTNALNRVPASRLGIVWLPASMHGSAGLTHQAQRRLKLEEFPGIRVLNDGPEARDPAHTAPAIAIEIPANWTTLQHEALEVAQAWRATTDAILKQHLGFTPGRYVVTDVARDEGRCYLVAEAFRPNLIGE